MQRDQLAPDVRIRLQRLPEPYAGHYGVVPAPPPEHGLPLNDIALRHEAAIAAMARVDTIAKTINNPFFISRLLVRQEAVSSSAIEGTYSTLNELLQVEETNENPTPATRQVRDYVLVLSRFIDQARTNGPSIFTPDLVKELHAQIMREDKSYRDSPGALRNSVVWIGPGGDISRSSWNPPPPDQVKACLEQSVDYMRNKGIQQTSQSFITRMAISHAHFEAVHPFRDGNGRVGRILLQLMMAAEGHVPLYLSPYIEARRGGYYGALKRAQQKLDWEAIIGFICNAIIDTVRHLDETIVAVDALRAAWIGRRTFRKNSAASKALDVLVRYPIITISRLASELGASYEQASKAMTQLAEVGIVLERTGYKRNRIFAACEMLEIINRPYDD